MGTARVPGIGALSADGEPPVTTLSPIEKTAVFAPFQSSKVESSVWHVDGLVPSHAPRDGDRVGGLPPRLRLQSCPIRGSLWPYEAKAKAAIGSTHGLEGVENTVLGGSWIMRVD